MFDTIIQKTFRIPRLAGRMGPGGAYARRLDIALLEVGFKLSGDALGYFATLHPDVIEEQGKAILAAVRPLIGAHIRHNVYFKSFPQGIPDTIEFWWECIADALATPDVAEEITAQIAAGAVNLLDLPRYGTPQHGYEDMVAAHERFLPSLKDRVTLLHLGDALGDEITHLYLALAESAVPLNEEDRALLGKLAVLCLEGAQPAAIPIRENRAIINALRLGQVPLLVDTVTDVLRIACAASGGDVTLQEVTRLRSFRRVERRALMVALDKILTHSPAKIVDIKPDAEVWKRLGERLHPHEYPMLVAAQEVFAVARGEKTVFSPAARVTEALQHQDPDAAVRLLAKNPGLLFRTLDVMLRAGAAPAQVMEAMEMTIGKVSTRVLFSLREHLYNRTTPNAKRIFVNRKGKAWVTDDTRAPLASAVIEQVNSILDAELIRRLPAAEHILVDPLVQRIALPLSEKSKAEGFGILPRGSVFPVPAGLLRFFVYWKEKARRTDYDLSALFLDEHFQRVGQVSWTNLRHGERTSTDHWTSVHSGDITNAKEGASEFIDISLPNVQGAYIIPQLNIFSGEDFTKVEECFFGFMNLNQEQQGLPFEPRTVRVKSNLRGKGKVALPLVFRRIHSQQWEAKWMHLYLKGSPRMNRVETNRLSTSLLAQAILTRQYVTVGDEIDLYARRGATILPYEGKRSIPGHPVLFFGMEEVEGLAKGSRAYTQTSLARLITDLTA